MQRNNEPRYQPLFGWGFDLLVRLDLQTPGILAEVCRMKAERRQAALAVLSRRARPLLGQGSYSIACARPVTGELTALAEVAADIRRLSAHDLIERYLGACPDGFIGALSKLRPGQPSEQIPPDTYDCLFETFTSPSKRDLARLIRHLPSICPEQLQGLALLKPIFLVPRFASHLQCEAEAVDLNAFLAIFERRRPAILDRLSEALRDFDPRTTIADWVRRWAYEIPFHEQTFPTPEGFEQLDNGTKLKDAALRHRNCLGSFEILQAVLESRFSYFENRELALIVEVAFVGPERLPEIDAVFTTENKRVRGSLKQLAYDRFAAVGVVRRRMGIPDPEVRSALRLGKCVDQDVDGSDDLGAFFRLPI